MKDLPIYETFYSWQGEGAHAGRSAFFIRTFGCPVQCPWCDSAGTWHPDWVPDRIERRSVDRLVDAVVESKASFVVVTGGEPTIHDLTSLTFALRSLQIPVHLETSGAFPIQGDFDWITLSPKWAKLPLIENLAKADELKLIVENGTSIADWWAKIGDSVQSRHVWLHPEWTQRENPVVLSSISSWVKSYGDPFRAGFQTHRLYNVDALDSRSRPPIPLGGNPQFGC